MNASDKDSDYCRRTAACILAEARQHSQAKAPQNQAERRVGSPGGMRQEPTRTLLGFYRETRNPHENSRTLRGLFQSTGGLYFPQDHSQRRPETYVGSTGHKNWLRTRCARLRAERELRARQQRSTNF